ncbi:MAG: DEAD/DEAH box helicase family protein [Clostridiales bacterium]|nr:DEAD/DEAH box helicase family protein [Clostridiales bacterium]
MPIINLLWYDFDKLKRNEDGTIVYDERFKEITKNLLNHESFDSTMYHTYDEFFNAVTNGSVTYDRQENDKSDDVNASENETQPIDEKDSLAIAKRVREMLITPSKSVLPPDMRIFRLTKGCKSKYRYVSDVLTMKIWQFWQPGEQVFISAGTGRGKNTFIKNELLKHCGNQKVVIFENRQSLMQQQIIDIISEIDPEVLKYNDISKDNMVIFGAYKNIMIISYQCAALKCMLRNNRFLDFCSQARYLIFDEAHYILDDANFNKGISFFAQTFLKKSFSNATKIFMSGTMEEIYEYIQLINRLPKEPVDIIQEKELFYKTGNIPARLALKGFGDNSNDNLILSLPTDYSYIQPYKYKTIDDICSQIAQTPINEKWMIFVKSINEGVMLKLGLQGICNNSVYFLNAENKNDNENAEIYNQLIRECRFNCRVLIATTVIYNGINVKDNNVKHIVVPFAPMSVVKQLLGRKRMAKNETVKVYFPDVSCKNVKKRYRDCIKDCMEIINLNFNMKQNVACQLNGLVNSFTSKYYYLSPNGSSANNYMSAQFNYPAIYKLYYDTCFYIFALQRMNPESKDTKSDFIKILLTHLDIEDKYDDVIDITVKTSKEEIEEAKAAFSEYLENLIGIDIISPDENGSFEKFLELKGKINEMYKILHEGKSLHTQWNTKDRFFPEEKMKAFFSELNLPYTISSASSKGKRITKITKSL